MRKRLEPGQTYFDLIKSDNQSYLDKKKIVISDCDGVLTDGNATYSVNGKVEKTFGAYDTEMMSFMRTQGWEFLFVSKDKTGEGITTTRVKDMNSPLIITDGPGRANIVEEKVKEGYIVLFVGDSLSDIQAMSAATYAACPNNAVYECRGYVDFVSPVNGGHGALGEILMWIHRSATTNWNR